MSFKDLGVEQSIHHALEWHGIKEPMPVQESVIPVMMKGKDVIVRAKTGSGKTIAFLVPIIQRLEKKGIIQAVILVPTRELAVQIGKEFGKLTHEFKSVLVYGGVGIQPQIDAIRSGSQVMIGTPGRILDLISRGALNLSHVRFVVLDEADRMFEMGFIDDIKDILKHTPHSRQTTFFSATIPPEVIRLSRLYMKNPEHIILDKDEITVKNIRQVFYGVDSRRKVDALLAYLRLARPDKALIFCNTKHYSDTLCMILNRRGIHAEVIHSNLSQNQRERVMDAFKAGKFRFLVATDVAARGLHIPEVSHVINFDVPKNSKDYVHRIGRTGRAGRGGVAVTLVVTEDSRSIREIEVELQKYIDVIDARETILKRYLGRKG